MKKTNFIIFMLLILILIAGCGGKEEADKLAKDTQEKIEIKDEDENKEVESV
ncbi:MAG: hypothetical protein Q4P34_01930 [Tissierellia bacterium]|nr:hypothetical protein [Tissierellia bacterium]